MKNYQKHGKTIPLTMTGTVSSGDVVVIGSIVGVVQTDGVSGDVVETLVEGVVELTKNTSVAMTEGLAVYWDATPGEITNTSDTGANKLVGVAIEVAASAATKAMVRLNGSFS